MKSQVCTTIEQSKKLLELGLKPETADMIHTTIKGRLPVVLVLQGDDFVEYPDIPAWSLHRLIEFISNSSILCMWPMYKLTYDFLIAQIETYIKNGFFNKEYLI